MATVTRADLAAEVREAAGLRKRDAAELVDMLLEAICERLAAGERVGISGFGTFDVRDKSERTGRDPRTGEEAPIAARRVVTFPGVRETEEARDGGDGGRGGRRTGRRQRRSCIIARSFESADGTGQWMELHRAGSTRAH